LSADTVLDPNDTILCARGVPALNGYASSSSSTNCVVPGDVSPGKYTLFAKADVDLAVCESIESNNGKSKLIYIGPDLTGSLAVATDATTAGALLVTLATRNAGGNTAPPSLARVYLSMDYTLDQEDFPLADVHVKELLPGATERVTTTVTVPASVGPGTVYLIAVIDAPGEILEARETNNQARTSVTIW
jgi:hypothetical protein